MKRMFQDTLILLIITLIAGLALGFVYEVTKEPITVQEEKTRMEAFARVFDEAATFDAREGFTPVADYEGVQISEVVEAKDASGTLLGYILVLTTKEGYGGDITFSMGITLDGTLNGISITEISETAGLGMNAEKVLVPQFADKKVESFQLVKDGALYENQIDAISSATITSSAITDAVNTGLAFYRNELGGAVNE